MVFITQRVNLGRKVSPALTGIYTGRSKLQAFAFMGLEWDIQEQHGQLLLAANPGAQARTAAPFISLPCKTLLLSRKSL